MTTSLTSLTSLTTRYMLEERNDQWAPWRGVLTADDRTALEAFVSVCPDGGLTRIVVLPAGSTQG